MSGGFEVKVLWDRCKGCGYCIDICPRDVLDFSDALNRRGYHPPFAKHPQRCVGCRLCEVICPDFAIYIEERPGAENPNPGS